MELVSPVKIRLGYLTRVQQHVSKARTGLVEDRSYHGTMVEYHQSGAARWLTYDPQLTRLPGQVKQLKDVGERELTQ